VSYPGGWRPHIEGALRLDVWRMHKLGCIRDGAVGTWQWTCDGEQTASIGYAVQLDGDDGTLTLDYTHTNRDGAREAVRHDVRLSSIPLHYGRQRWYAHCPYTGQRARKLYKFSGIDRFCHRTAIRPLPTYAIQRVSGTERINTQRWRLRRKLGNTFGDLFGEPFKPKRMHWRTFERYAARDAELVERENIYLLRMIGRMARYSAG